jgi:hypothetical protein
MNMGAGFNAEQSHASLDHQIKSECAYIRDALHRIEAQTVRTNGRVTRLERWQIALMTAIGVLATVKWPELKAIIGLFN